jgi:hypothetical protein
MTRERETAGACERVSERVCERSDKVSVKVFDSYVHHAALLDSAEARPER